MINLLVFSFRALILNLLIEMRLDLIIPPCVVFCSSKNCFIDFVILFRCAWVVQRGKVVFVWVGFVLVALIRLVLALA